jgi:small subunit ribosomal protein S20
MANTSSAKKATRKIAARTLIRKVEEAIASGDKSAAEAAMKVAQPELARGASKGVMHRNTVSRKISRLTKRVAGVGA